MEEGIINPTATICPFQILHKDISGCRLGLPGVSEVSGNGDRLHCSDDAIGGAADGPQVHAILHVVLLQLGQDVLAIGVLAESRDVRPDLWGKDRQPVVLA